MRLTFLLLASLLILSAQPVPDAADLLAQRGGVLKNHYSVQYTEVATAGGMNITTTLQAAGSKFRTETKMDGADGILVVGDGQSVWMYMPVMETYSKIPETTDAAQGAILGDLVEDSSITASAKVIRSEAVQIDGQSHDCWVVESRVDSDVYTWWIDKALGLALKTATVANGVPDFGANSAY